jgi:hypothetical protein
MSIPELLVSDGFITSDDKQRIENLSAKIGSSFVKTALNFGYISRKNYDRALNNANYKIEYIASQPFDTEVLKKITLEFADARLALPLRIENNKVITVMADPTDRVFLDFVKTTYGLEPQIIIAADLDILWLSHKLIGDKHVKSAVYELMNNDSLSSAIVTFTTPQLVFVFVLIALSAIGLVVSFKNTSIFINIILSSFFLIAIIFKLFLALVGSRFELHQAVSKEEVRLIRDEDLPIYTILLPVYKEY